MTGAEVSGQGLEELLEKVALNLVPGGSGWPEHGRGHSELREQNNKRATSKERGSVTCYPIHIATCCHFSERRHFQSYHRGGGNGE